LAHDKNRSKAQPGRHDAQRSRSLRADAKRGEEVAATAHTEADRHGASRTFSQTQRVYDVKKITIETPAFELNGKPVCSISENENCRFLSFRRMGFQPCCQFGGDLYRPYDDVLGYITPPKTGCIVWPKTESKS